MASEPDDNPFVRNSVWPKMPQAPFRVGGVPNTGGMPLRPSDAGRPAEAEPEPEPAPRTITPLFVRPLEAPAPGAQLLGGAVPQPTPRPAPETPRAVAPPPPPEPVAALEPVAAAEPVAAFVEPDPEPAPFELSEVVVTPLNRRPPARPKARGRSHAPMIAAAVLGLGGIAAVVFFFVSRTPSTPLVSGATVTIPITPRAATAPAAVVADTAPVQPAAGPAPPAQPTRSGAAMSARAAAPPTLVLPRRLPSDAAVATEEAINAPVLALPPPPPQPAPEPAPTYRPPPAADPGAPIRTQRPY